MIAPSWLWLLAACNDGYTPTKVEKLLGVSPSLQDAGSLAVGESATVVFSLQWKQGDAIDVVGLSFLGDEAFSTSATTPFTVPVDGTVELEVAYSPTEAGYHSAQLEISTDEEDVDSHVVEVRGRAASTDIQVYPEVLDFGPVDPGDSGSAAVTIQNNGAFTIEVDGASSDNPLFAVATATPFSVSGQSSVDVQALFSPTDAEAASGSLELSFGEAGAVAIPVRGNDCEAGEAALYDQDGDGWTTCGGDCDDGAETVNPLYAEICDEVDQDCDGEIDEDTDCHDDDGDGFTEEDGDCHDGDAGIGPEATEDMSDGIDNDCDGIVDAGTSDADGDGWAPEGGDCDDADASVHPGATESGDGVDEDCDGLTDEGTSLYDDDGDGWTEVAGDCDDSEASVSPAASEDADGRDDDCDGAVDEGTDRSDDDGDGFTEEGGDCDDADPAVSPAELEQEGNGLDDDCDGVAG